MDPHVHTRYSGHSLVKPETVAARARKVGLDMVAVTDHNEVKGAFETAKLFPTIVGEEVSTDEGDVIGLFVTEKVERGPVLDVMDKIRAQGGVVVIPHPFDSLRHEAVDSEKVCSKADAIEVFNSRVVREADNDRALAFADKAGILKIVGSDAHTYHEIGKSYIEIEPFEDASSFLKSLGNAKLNTCRSCALLHAWTKAIKVREAFR